jgi:DNA helicase IV
VPHFPDEMTMLFLKQKKEKVLDRFDLTILMRAWLHSSGGLTTEQTTYKQLKEGKVERIKKKVPFKYALMVLDEVQNYLPEQIQVLRSCADKNNALVYVGDLAQQSRLCTVRDWAEVGENFIEERKVVLQKNYRSTKQILSYIKQLGYDVEIPATIKEGGEVEDRIATQQEELIQVRKIVGENKGVLVGVLAKSEVYLELFKSEFSASKNVHVLTINEAQGVEFDVVCLVGMAKDFFSADYEEAQLREEKKRVNKDLLYVALTRAMNSLYVFGKEKLSEIVG